VNCPVSWRDRIGLVFSVWSSFPTTIIIQSFVLTDICSLLHSDEYIFLSLLYWTPAQCRLPRCFLIMTNLLRPDPTPKGKAALVGSDTFESTRNSWFCLNCWHLSSYGISRDLGAWFDSHVSVNTHVVKVCRKAFRGLYTTRQIRKFLSEESTKTLVHAFVRSHLSYCNSLLYGAIVTGYRRSLMLLLGWFLLSRSLTIWPSCGKLYFNV